MSDNKQITINLEALKWVGAGLVVMLVIWGVWAGFKAVDRLTQPTDTTVGYLTDDEKQERVDRAERIANAATTTTSSTTTTVPAQDGPVQQNEIVEAGGYIVFVESLLPNGNVNICVVNTKSSHGPTINFKLDGRDAIKPAIKSLNGKNHDCEVIRFTGESSAGNVLEVTSSNTTKLIELRRVENGNHIVNANNDICNADNDALMQIPYRRVKNQELAELQARLGVPDDGRIGPKTRGAYNTLCSTPRD